MRVIARTSALSAAQPSSLRERMKGLGVVRELRAQRARRGFARERFGSVHPALAREGVIFEELVARFGSETERIARKQGYAVAIGHPHPATIAVLKRWLPAAKAQGFAIVPLTAIVKKREGVAG